MGGCGPIVSVGYRVDASLRGTGRSIRVAPGVRSLFAGKISSPKWPEEGLPPRRSGGVRTTFSGEPMAQSALTDTSRLTATTCDRERGHAGQLSGITLHTKTRATLGLGAIGTFRPRADGALGRGAPLTFLALKVLRWVANWGRTAVAEAMACIFSVVACADMVTDEGVAADFGKTRANPSRKIHSARPHPIRMRRDFQRVARFRIHMG